MIVTRRAVSPGVKPEAASSAIVCGGFVGYVVETDGVG